MANVKARWKLKARVCVWNATSGPKEGAQWHVMKNCEQSMSQSEFNWRWAAIQAIACTGTTDYTSYSDAIGSGWI